MRIRLFAPAALLCALPALAQEAEPPITLPRLSQPITVDGDLSDPGWQEASKIEVFYETNVGDNTAPPVKTTAWVAYDARFFYAAFLCEDPNTAKIRAPFVDRDNVFSDQDFVGLFLDTRNDRRSAIEFFVNARGIQDDGITNDATGSEDFSPDFFWDSTARITAQGWVAEIRIPLSSLRYPNTDPQTWGLILYRNYPRDFRYQIFNVRLPRGGNCLVCRSLELTGITGLPQGAHFVIAPYATANATGEPRSGEPGGDFVNRPIEGDLGGDIKWIPSADTAVDATINPDFSQIESDVPQISVNERFALFFPEKRPFFLEGLDLFETPLGVVYTRTITSPRWGVRGTGKLGATSYTLLATQDRGGGTVIVPGPQFSQFAPQDFSSIAVIGRARRDFGTSFVSFLVSDRENAGGSYNRLFGPDFQWRPSEQDQVTGQALYSLTETPDRPELFAEWDGRKLSAPAYFLSWLHSTRTWTWRTTYEDVGTDFRADNGFVPRVGYRRGRNYLGHAFYPTGLLSRVEPFVVVDVYGGRDGELLTGRVYPGVQFRGKASLQGEIFLNMERIRVGEKLLEQTHAFYFVRVSPSRLVPNLSAEGFIGQSIDFENGREGTGGSIELAATARPTDHLDLQLLAEREWLDVTAENERHGRLFTATIARLRAAYTFSARMFLRLVAQYVEVDRDPSLYVNPVPANDGGFDGSLLFSYKLNWQTVLFVGYGDSRALLETGNLARQQRQLFLKVSYAFQR